MENNNDDTPTVADFIENLFDEINLEDGSTIAATINDTINATTNTENHNSALFHAAGF